MKINFELTGMHLKENLVMIHHIYETSTHRYVKKKSHPLELICESMKEEYNMEIRTLIDSNKQDAIVSINYDDRVSKQKIQKLTLRFIQTTECLLNVTLIKMIN